MANIHYFGIEGKNEANEIIQFNQQFLSLPNDYTIINICLISDILQKYHHFLVEMLGDSILFRTFAPLLKTI
jgi:hypothetical protein